MVGSPRLHLAVIAVRTRPALVVDEDLVFAQIGPLADVRRPRRRRRGEVKCRAADDAYRLVTSIPVVAGPSSCVILGHDETAADVLVGKLFRT